MVKETRAHTAEASQGVPRMPKEWSWLGTSSKAEISQYTPVQSQYIVKHEHPSALIVIQLLLNPKVIPHHPGYPNPFTRTPRTPYCPSSRDLMPGLWESLTNIRAFS